jgi:hypothetical protein
VHQNSATRRFMWALVSMPLSAPPQPASSYVERLHSLAARKACLRQACQVYPSEVGLVNLQQLSTKTFFILLFCK